MKRSEQYVQVELRKQNAEGWWLIDVAWIPRELARRGNIVNVKMNDVWDNGWRVENVYSCDDIDELQRIRNDRREAEWKLGR
jgi:hypothetical protein